MSYALTIERAAQKNLEKISPPHQERVIEAIEGPRGRPAAAGVRRRRRGR